MDHILANTFLQVEISSSIIKTEISDHFPIFATMEITKIENNIPPKIIRTHKVSESSFDSLRSLLKIIDWDLVKQSNSTNYPHKIFLDLFIKTYDQTLGIKIKANSFLCSWRTKRIKNPLKQNKNYMKNFCRKEHIKMKEVTKTINIYLKRF